MFEGGCEVLIGVLGGREDGGGRGGGVWEAFCVVVRR